MVTDKLTDGHMAEIKPAQLKLHGKAGAVQRDGVVTVELETTGNGGSPRTGMAKLTGRGLLTSSGHRDLTPGSLRPDDTVVSMRPIWWFENLTRHGGYVPKSSSISFIASLICS